LAVVLKKDCGKMWKIAIRIWVTCTATRGKSHFSGIWQRCKI